MKLVTFEEPIFVTTQGEGVLFGMPSTFVRLWGCDFSCSWCDTKDSWREGSTWRERPQHHVATEVVLAGMKHVVITGGNPVLQAGEVYQLTTHLRALGHHVTLETQGSVYDRMLMAEVDLLSLSPKLHDWRAVELMQAIDCAREAQVKIVVANEVEFVQAMTHFRTIHEWARRKTPHLILQPEFSCGRKLVVMVQSLLQRWIQTNGLPFNVRVIPQLHKTSLFVK